jgi:hypothetical protein
MNIIDAFQGLGSYRAAARLYGTRRFLPEQTTATSMIDHLLHHSVVVVTQGEPFRMREARSRGGDRLKK